MVIKTLILYVIIKNTICVLAVVIFSRAVHNLHYYYTSYDYCLAINRSGATTGAIIMSLKVARLRINST